MKIIIPKNVGYFDVTKLPYGGDFCRAKEDMEVTISGEWKCNYIVHTPDGRKLVVKKELIKKE